MFIKMPEWDSFIMNKAGKPVEKEEISQRMCSKEGLQWLPAEFLVDEERSICCINSLHPVVHVDMYNFIGQAFLQVLLLLEHVISQLETTESP